MKYALSVGALCLTAVMFSILTKVMWSIYPYPSGLLHCHRGSHTIVPVPEGHRQTQPYWKHKNVSVLCTHYSDVIMAVMASQITIVSIVFRRRPPPKKKTKLCVTGLCEGNWPVAGEFPSQRASNAENVSIWWRHHDISWDVMYMQRTIRTVCVLLRLTLLWYRFIYPYASGSMHIKLILSVAVRHCTRCTHLYYSNLVITG